MRKQAIITGVTGQDGSYLAEFLLEKEYDVHGIARRSSSPNTDRIKHLLHHPRFHLHEGDLGDSCSLKRTFDAVRPHEVYNLGAMSHVKVSFDVPEYTANIDALGTLRILEILKTSYPHAKFYQASTSELFGKVVETPQSETTPFYPRSPYGVSKLYAYWTVVNYREAYGLFCCNGILFNHESPRRGETFVTRKITMGIARIKEGLQKTIVLGNLDAVRDWGFAPDFVEGMWLMLQQTTPEDFVLATGVMTSVRRFVEIAFGCVGIEVVWEGKGKDERGLNRVTGEVIVEVSPEFYRPTEVELLCGDATKAFTKLGWKPKTSVEELIRLMVDSDVALVEQFQLAKR